MLELASGEAANLAAAVGAMADMSAPAPEISEETQNLLFDPQTSGGLLLAVPRRKLAGLLKRAEELEQAAWVVGEVAAGKGIEVL